MQHRSIPGTPGGIISSALSVIGWAAFWSLLIALSVFLAIAVHMVWSLHG
jgi:hypothetical protein